MSKVKIELNSAGVRELLKRDAVAGLCDQLAANAAMNAGEGYVTERRTYPERVGTAIYAATREARKDNLENNTLLRVIS